MSEFESRLTRFQTLLEGRAEVAYFPISSDLQYLTGIPRDIPNFGAVMHPGAWVEGAWLVPGKQPVLLLPRMTAQFGGLGDMSNVDVRVLGDWDDPAKLVVSILQEMNVPEKPRMALSDYATGETVVGIQALLPNVSFLSATDILREMRVIKSEYEIEMMRKAGAITEAAFADVLSLLKHGMTELEVISEVNFQLKQHGSLGPSFVTSLYNSGPNHPLSFERQQTWKRKLEPPVTILFDFGAAYEGFCYDFGRTVFFGEPPEEVRNIHALVMKSQRIGIAAMKADSVTAEAADKAARNVLEAAGYGEMFRHRLGHGIGMDVHEPPFLTNGDTTILRDGMLFTVEPSIMQFETFSARVEDVVVVRAEGGEALTSGYQELIVVE